jgi:Dyggve-Melchior-Clausen syndrome protein
MVLTRLRDNPNLVYALLHNHQVFRQYASNMRLSPFVQNIESVLDIVDPHVNQLDVNDVSSDQVLEVIVNALGSAVLQNSVRIEPIRFKIVDTDDSHKFLLAGVWATGNDVFSFLCNAGVSYLMAHWATPISVLK